MNLRQVNLNNTHWNRNRLWYLSCASFLCARVLLGSRLSRQLKFHPDLSGMSNFLRVWRVRCCAGPERKTHAHFMTTVPAARSPYSATALGYHPESSSTGGYVAVVRCFSDDSMGCPGKASVLSHPTVARVDRILASSPIYYGRLGSLRALENGRSLSVGMALTQASSCCSSGVLCGSSWRFTGRFLQLILRQNFESVSFECALR